MKNGFICGAWDLLHAGHVMTLAMCKDQCDKLIVGLHINPNLERKEKNVPVQSVLERWIQLRECKSVDVIVPYETEEDLLIILQNFDIDIRFVGEDYKDGKKEITGKDIVPIEFIERRHPYSSSELRKRLK